uniref:C3H1-type domain-containing protein n=1 Tax=Globodera rostochiensis TaxID=31243 RepID=A0A914IG81_GLORO
MGDEAYEKALNSFNNENKQSQTGNNSNQNCGKSKEGPALINKHIETVLESTFPKMLPLPTPQAQPFSLAKRSLLAKNASTTDLTQYINPDIANRRRSSLFCITVDPAMKRMRQREAYKTAMCQAWLEGRPCVYSDQCNFAHGEDELQPLPSSRANPKHKTRICENYTTTGICPFGNRCFFIHPKTEEELETLLKYNENFPQHVHHQVEDETLLTRSMVRSPQVGTVRRIGGKLKQFRKMDSCGTFNLPYHVQNEYKQQWPSSNTGENYEQFPPLSTSTIAGMLAGKSLINMKSSATSSMPSIHSSSVTNLNYTSTSNKQIENVEKELDKRLEAMRLTMRKMQQQKSFSSSDVCVSRTSTQSTVFEKQEEAEQHSSGPHTPPGLTAYSFPGFYEQEKLGWSNNSLANVWSPPATAAAEEQAVPTFCFFEAKDKIGGGPNIENVPMLRTGKRSPDFEGILMGRRSSHIPLLEDYSEMLLNVTESGMQKGRNKSAEYLGGKECAKNNDALSVVVNAWQSAKRSTSALNEQNRIQPQFGGVDGGGGTAEKQHKDSTQWGEIGQQCDSSKLLKNLQTINDGGASKVGQNFINNNNNIMQTIRGPLICSNRAGISNLDKMHHLWTSSSPNLDKHREDSSSIHQLWTPFGMQKVEIPSQIDLAGNYHDSSLNLSSEQRDRIDTLTIENHQHEEKEEAELINLYRKFQLNEENTMKDQKHESSGNDEGLNEFINPTWAQMVRRKAYLRQKSRSSPAINRNSAQSAGNM